MIRSFEAKLQTADAPQTLAWAYKEYASALRAGNEAFAEGAHRAAMAPYAKALRIAERLFQRAAQCGLGVESAASALVDARHNISENLRRQGRFEEAFTHLLAAARTICWGRTASKAEERFRDTCERELPRVMEAVVGHLQMTGATPEQIAEAYRMVSLNPMRPCAD